MDYDHAAIEKKWQKYWLEHKTFKTPDHAEGKPKFYCLDMFPYPSGAGLHVGHPEGYTATDILNALGNTVAENVTVMAVGSSAMRLVDKGILTMTLDEKKKKHYTKG